MHRSSLSLSLSLDWQPTTKRDREELEIEANRGGRGGGGGGGGASRDRYLGDSAISRGRQISVNPGSLARLMPGFHLRARQAGGKVWDGWVTIHRRRCHCRPSPPPPPYSYGCNEVGGLHTGIHTHTHVETLEKGKRGGEEGNEQGESGWPPGINPPSPPSSKNTLATDYNRVCARNTSLGVRQDGTGAGYDSFSTIWEQPFHSTPVFLSLSLLLSLIHTRI